ncbi:hypothetical protein [Mesorhizobium carmichaelinearum]|uniref:hypothetical protein n=1 Tax=Mesorhizobium carmichaelinearum TaxID=1208188 RepID=UPI00117D1C55|nr:hypothetical protein [Mesorhizobium carmichaelinearum]
MNVQELMIISRVRWTITFYVTPRHDYASFLASAGLKFVRISLTQTIVPGALFREEAYAVLH